MQHRRALRRGSALVVLVLAAAGASAQGPGSGTGSPATTSAVPQSARQAMRAFLEAFYREDGPDLDAAVECMDLSELPSEARAVRGRELAVELKDVIDRTRLVDFERIPDAPDGPPFVFLRRTEGEVVIAPIPDRGWLFTADTVRSLDALTRALASKRVVEGVEPVSRALTPATWVRSVVPEALRQRIVFLEGWQWLGLVLVVLLGVIADRVVTFLLTGSMVGLARRRFTLLDTGLVTRTLRPVGLLVMVSVWGLGILWLGLPVKVLAIYLDAVRMLATVVAVLTVYRLVDLVSDLLGKRAAQTESRFDDLLVPLVRKTAKVIVVAFGLVFIADNLNQDVSSLIAGLGLGGLAFALAAKDAVSNLFGSVTVLLDRPFQVGDWIKVGDVEGTVEELGFRSTRVRTFYNSLITLPNSNLTNTGVDNLGARRYRRWSTRLAITYDTPPALVDAFCEGIRELVRRHPYTRKDYFHVYLNEFGAAALEVMLYVFFETPDWATELRERHRMGVDILRLAQELGVEFAFPTQTVYLRREEWSARSSEPDGYVDGSKAGTRDARRAARELAEGPLAGAVPPPVTFSEEA